MIMEVRARTKEAKIEKRAKKSKESKESKESKDSKYSKESKEIKENKESKGSKGSKEGYTYGDDPFTDLGKEGECAFSIDCKNVERCKDIEKFYSKFRGPLTSGCFCNFGKCELDYNNQAVNYKECDTHKDCSCKSDPKNCFCHIGQCVVKGKGLPKGQLWECHQLEWAPGKSLLSPECDAMEKCKGKKCSCRSNRCEWECEKAKDCETKDYDCFRDPGTLCECHEGMCDPIFPEEDKMKTK